MVELLVKYYNTNGNRIEDYDVLKRRELEIKQLKKKCTTKYEFSEFLRREFMWRFWSKAEWELVITKTVDGMVILSPWCGCANPDTCSIGLVLPTNILNVRFLKIRQRLMCMTKLCMETDFQIL